MNQLFSHLSYIDGWLWLVEVVNSLLQRITEHKGVHFLIIFPRSSVLWCFEEEIRILRELSDLAIVDVGCLLHVLSWLLADKAGFG